MENSSHAPHMHFFRTKIPKLPPIYVLIPKVPLLKKKNRKKGGGRTTPIGCGGGEPFRPDGGGLATPLAKWGWSNHP
jgi:hypothetical protein